MNKCMKCGEKLVNCKVAVVDNKSNRINYHFIGEDEYFDRDKQVFHRDCFKQTIVKQNQVKTEGELESGSA